MQKKKIHQYRSSTNVRLERFFRRKIVSFLTLVPKREDSSAWNRDFFFLPKLAKLNPSSSDNPCRHFFFFLQPIRIPLLSFSNEAPRFSFFLSFKIVGDAFETTFLALQ